LFRAIESHVAVRGPLSDRAEYENELRRSDIVVSTTDHEFFGIAVVEAAMAGAIPILPNAHAYPETLPSAVFYEAGNIDALTNHLTRVIERQWGSIRPWVHDARRFLPARTVTVFDEAVEELSKDNRVIRETD
jgi:glycosyltransferase involved in cell wall biosynthesis